MKALLAENADVDAKDGLTALMITASNGDTDTVKALLDKGADLNIKFQGGSKALKFAEKKGHKDVVILLKQAGATE